MLSLNTLISAYIAIVHYVYKYIVLRALKLWIIKYSYPTFTAVFVKKKLDKSEFFYCVIYKTILSCTLAHHSACLVYMATIFY